MTRIIRRIVDLFCDVPFWFYCVFFKYLKRLYDDIGWDDIYQTTALGCCGDDLIEQLEEHKILRAGKNGTIVSFNLRRLLMIAKPYTAGMVIGSFLKSCPLELLEEFECYFSVRIPAERGQISHSLEGLNDLNSNKRKGMAAYLIAKMRKLLRKHPELISEVISGVYYRHPNLADELKVEVYSTGYNALCIYNPLERSL
ncbi:hypothetical protein COU01_00215 [Candidatus Falkowbacteria bacterium CG10_big_fil_rev_8_21_14_0_10_44_15]|uniref:Uncharacterized protein n=1 Tax=Candidatus Falkowbacteria bacterium CG10_big_fil_rev_8_21_14_0_10_44_15 TaxID=1974569 RepID=A0A2H0V0Q8_9BACT|nr:MAG: hypothetical protein COU01_00215 [Candidatus Falkowbacteria bacterium CG10_big_fil_rev_8_21_14_0_10_44_15]